MTGEETLLQKRFLELAEKAYARGIYTFPLFWAWQNRIFSPVPNGNYPMSPTMLSAVPRAASGS